MYHVTIGRKTHTTTTLVDAKKFIRASTMIPLSIINTLKSDFGKTSISFLDETAVVYNDGVTKADLAQIEEFHRFCKSNLNDHPNHPEVSIMPVSDWVTGLGKYTKARSLPRGCEIHMKNSSWLPDYAKEFFQNRPRCHRIVVLAK